MSGMENVSHRRGMEILKDSDPEDRCIQLVKQKLTSIENIFHSSKLKKKIYQHTNGYFSPVTMPPLPSKLQLWSISKQKNNKKVKNKLRFNLIVQKKKVSWNISCRLRFQAFPR